MQHSLPESWPCRPGRFLPSAVIAPGGAFHFLMIDHEGYEMARWLAERGVTAFVLKYRLGRTPDADAEVLAFRNDLQRRLLATGPLGSAPPANEQLQEIRLLGEEDGRQAIQTGVDLGEVGEFHWIIALQGVAESLQAPLPASPVHHFR